MEEMYPAEQSSSVDVIQLDENTIEYKSMVMNSVPLQFNDCIPCKNPPRLWRTTFYILFHIILSANIPQNKTFCFVRGKPTK